VKVAILADFPLHVLPEFGEEFRPAGHYATWLPQLAEAFASFTGLEAHWVVLNSQLSSPRKIAWRNQTFHVLPAATKHRASSLFRRDRAAISKTLDEIRPDVVHGWGTEDVYALAAVSSGRPNLISMQGILSHYMLKSRRRPREYFQGLLELYVLARAWRITVESAWGNAILARRNPHATISLVEYGVQPHFFEVAWQPNPQHPVAIFIGSLTPLKGLQDLVAAFRSPTLAGAELWVVGSGSGKWLDKLRRQAPVNIRWLGRKTSKETAALLGQAWCLALPTRADTSPNVVKESRVIGLPVITTPCGGQVSYVEDGGNGFLVKPGAINIWSEKLSILLGSLATAQKMGGHRQAEQRAWFQPENTAQGFWKIYQEMMPT
jgi:glycosyltransferase involved in cell wall biosynthesis